MCTDSLVAAIVHLESDIVTAGTARLVPLRLGVDAHRERVAFMRRGCTVCRSEGFEAHTRVSVHIGTRQVLAQLFVVDGDLIPDGTVGLSDAAWHALAPQPGELARFSHPLPLNSLRSVRRKIYGNTLAPEEFGDIIGDIVAGRYSNIDLAAFVAACGGERLNLEEITSLTQAMVRSGRRLTWDAAVVADKHSIGGLPGNRTTPIVVGIAVANGLLMPKTSSRAITSPAGTADTMEMLTRVDLSTDAMRAVVEKEGGCLTWGGTAELSPADDALIRIERALDVDSEGQMIASILSKKAAAGATHVVIDIPVGETAKVRTPEAAQRLAAALRLTGTAVGLRVETVISDGRQPVGRGIGPALEARDVLAVLQCLPEAPLDLRRRAIRLSATLLEMVGRAESGAGVVLATETLDSGAAWKKFQAICLAQGGFRVLPEAPLRHTIMATRQGRVLGVDCRRLGRLAKLAGAPGAGAAGILLHVRLGDTVVAGQPLFTLHAESQGELRYALDYLDGAAPTHVIA